MCILHRVSVAVRIGSGLERIRVSCKIIGVHIIHVEIRVGPARLQCTKCYVII